MTQSSSNFLHVVHYSVSWCSTFENYACDLAETLIKSISAILCSYGMCWWFLTQNRWHLQVYLLRKWSIYLVIYHLQFPVSNYWFMNAPIVVDPRRKNSSEASKMHFFLPPFSLQQAHVLKNSLGVRNKHCPDRNEGVNKNTNQEFPYKIAVI